ncbi:unnamed protein product [Miscanthus lutarioriparius]|uniref:Uncharacterized protein n=1 Tax=Miscanthus lutarioriparius TaxID=422564 RepID=A0A811RAZ2_9POAL|nr:unnamed protein product [Miscanthus lutarioriparius]
MSTSPPLAVLLVATAMALLLASSVIPAAAAAAVASGGRYGGGRMVFVHGPGRTKQVGGARGNEWRHYLARVEDEVAPEFGGILATNSRGGSISSGAQADLPERHPVRCQGRRVVLHPAVHVQKPMPALTMLEHV